MRAAGVLLLAVAVSGCAPRLRPLDGAPVPAVLPRAELSPEPQRIRFDWRYADETFRADGDGVVRVQPPGQARLDFFLRNGFGGGFAILAGDSLLTPGPDFVRRMIPPSPLLWAALGRLHLPPAADTAARSRGDTLLADIGRAADGPLWRVRFVAGRLDRVERVEDGRRVELLERDGGTVRYRHEAGRRRLDITVTDSSVAAPFDPAIFRAP